MSGLVTFVNRTLTCFVEGVLKFGLGNTKLPSSTLTFSLPAGHTCPGALLCHSQVSRHPSPTTGKYSIRDGKHTQFRCYAATEELRPTVRTARWHNYDLIQNLDTEELTQLFQLSITLHARYYTERVRWFVSGDCYSPVIRDAIANVASVSPYMHYFYTKNLPLFLDDHGGLRPLPDNLLVTASWGGKYDFLLHDGLFPRTARVVDTEEEAAGLGLPIDYNDAYAYAADPIHFAHLSHGTQPPGSAAGKAIRTRRAAGRFSGYSATGHASHITSSVPI